MKNKIFLVFLFHIISLTVCFAQKGQISGHLISENGNPIAYAKVTIKPSNKTIYTNIEGYFLSPRLAHNKYFITITSNTYSKYEDSVELSSNIIDVKFMLRIQKEKTLKEIEVTRKKEESFFIRKMKVIEGYTITQGKKTEVISLEQIDANKATNSSRQIFSRIPGLNIWESDGGGIQIGLGGRGLNPSRNVNFNTRQNGYDISADALGYPESYYTPPSEAVKEIQLIRGAASLQFGPQFGGLINYKLKKGNKNKKAEITLRHTIGSFGLNNSFASISGTINSWNYIAYGNYKIGDDWRPNSNFKLGHGHISISKKISKSSLVEIEFSKMYYLAQQAGGLTDNLFNNNPDTSVRARNWFRVDWNLASILFNHEINSNSRISSKTFGLIATRESLGYLDQINRIDPLEERNLIYANFKNIGNETKFLQIYTPFNNPWAFVTGIRIYKGYSNAIQGNANSEYGPDFYFIDLNGNQSNEYVATDYQFPSLNLALFGEHIFNVTNKLSLTPGIRYEYISTNANGKYRSTQEDLAGNIIFDTVISSNKTSNRGFIIAGLGINYKLNSDTELYQNFSQNYRSIHFTEMQINNPNFKIDPNLQDETGFNFDLGLRGDLKNKLFFDVSLYGMYYNNRIGTTLEVDSLLFSTFQYRTNISASRTFGFECIAEADWWKILFKDSAKFRLSTFVNFSYNNAQYINSKEEAFQNKLVELVPPYVLKTGVSFGNKLFSLSYQYSYTNEHFSDATNSTHQANAVNGLIPSYSVMDFSGKFTYKWVQIECGVNNLGNSLYFTRRAISYPGPGIIPSPTRNYYITLQIKF
ncbi:MAG: TonB-dependent receptor [Crocinitomicaceae bacterium]|nr:TonB-dependent receptor [Crocinitomicaceae bacterium]